MSFLIYQTIYKVVIIGADNLHEMQTYVDSSHEIYDDMEGHTGGANKFGTDVSESVPQIHLEWTF